MLNEKVSTTPNMARPRSGQLRVRREKAPRVTARRAATVLPGAGHTPHPCRTNSKRTPRLCRRQMRSLSEGLRACEPEHGWAKPEGCSRKGRAAKALRAESTASGGAGLALSAPGPVSQVSGSQGDGGQARAGLIRRYPAGRLPGGPGADPGADPGRGRRSGSRAGRKGTGLSSRLALRTLVTQQLG